MIASTKPAWPADGSASPRPAEPARRSAHTRRHRRGWRARIAASGLALGLLTLGSVALGTAGSAAAGSGWLRLAHFSPNTPPVDVYLYSFHNPTAKIVLHHVAYGTISPYEQVPAGAYTVAMRGAGASPSSAPVLSTTVNVAAGGAYTVAGMGPAKGLRLQILADRLTAPKGKALVRIIQASLRQHQVTFTAGRQLLARKLPFAKVTGYTAVPAGTWLVRAAGETQQAAAHISLTAGTIHTLVLLDDPGKLTIDDLVDAAGSKVIPAGAPATGFGGAAPRPAPVPTPWLILAGIGALAMLSSAGWTLRARGSHAAGRRRQRGAAA